MILIVSALEFLTWFIGVLALACIFITTDLGMILSFSNLLLLLISIPYVLGAYLLWNKKKSGLILSIIMNGLAVVDLNTKNLSFSLMNGFEYNLIVYGTGIDLWSLLLLIGLFYVSIRWKEYKAT